MPLNYHQHPDWGGVRTWAGAATAFLLFFATGCVVSSDDPPQEPNQETEGSPDPDHSGPDNQDDEVVASSTTTATDLGGDLQLDIYALERVGDDLLRLRFDVTNNSSENFILGYILSGEMDEDSGADISLIDNVNQQRYFSYRQSDDRCFCNSLDGNLESGSTEQLWVIFPEPPDNLESMTVVTPATPPISDVPITESSDNIQNNNLTDRQVLDLTLISDSLEDDGTGRTESSEEVSILLSSDVLFDTNSAELNDEALEILEQVAQEIDDASSSTISIDGHADNSGDDSINVPLSKDRAESVESSLSDLVTRNGVSFEVEGHGSADPIADNETDEGRERNRRVSVTFEK